MTHCITERGGRRTLLQQERIAQRRKSWRPKRAALSNSIRLLVNELSRFATPLRLRIDTDCHPIYADVIAKDAALGWYRSNHLLAVRRTSGSAPRTTENPLFLMNYVDRMMRHRLIEHARESIALAKSASAQMHRMWIFAWDHNARQPRRVAGTDSRSRAGMARVSPRLLDRLNREFNTRRHSIRGVPVPLSIRQVWTGTLESPQVSSRSTKGTLAPRIPAYARLDLELANHHGP
jgi:hypothetical protein